MWQCKENKCLIWASPHDLRFWDGRKLVQDTMNRSIIHYRCIPFLILPWATPWITHIQKHYCFSYCLNTIKVSYKHKQEVEISKKNKIKVKILGVGGGCIITSNPKLSMLHEQTFIAGFTAAGETTSPPLDGSQCHKRKRRGKKILKDRDGGEDGLAGSSSVGVWGCQAEEGNRSRITSEGLCVSVKLFSLSQKPLNRLADLL